jgi:hypothetical protein
MTIGATIEVETATGLCAACGTPVDSQYFDDSSVQPSPDQGEELVLARFDLPAQYCGVLQYFTQFTDAFAADASQISTPRIEWKVLVNNHALFPYVNLRHIVNPWGFGSYPVNIRLEEGTTVELVARGVEPDKTTGLPAGTDITLVGGRLVGRFWYNAAYGDLR